jgi:cell division protein FtsQ
MEAKKKLKLAFLALLLLLFFWQVVQAPWFLAIREIEVLHATTISPWEVEQIAGVARGMSLVKLDLGQIRSRLLADQRIFEAEVRRRLPGTLVISLQENVGVAAIPYFSSWLEVDQTGTVLAVTTQFSALNLPIVTGLEHEILTVGQKVSDQTRWQVASDCLMRLPPDLLAQISEINVSDPQSIVLYSRDPLRILLGDCKNLDQKFTALVGMLGRIREDQQVDLSAGQLDVSSGRAVFIKER